MKKIIGVFIVLLILGGAGGFFYWWKSQADVREMNKGLPEGVRVAKSFRGQYKVVNKKDGYVVRVPGAWKGLAEVEYSEEKDGAGLSLEGIEGYARSIGIAQYNLNEDIQLEDWAKREIQRSGLSVEDIPEESKKKFRFPTGIGIINRENIEGFEVIEVEVEYLSGTLLYFFKKDLKIYEVSGMSEEFIREIILKSEW